MTLQIKEIIGEAPRPIWARLPKRGQVLEGLSRGFLYKLITAGKIKSISLKEPGAKRGCRLICIASVRQYLANIQEAQGFQDGGEQ